MAIGGRTIGELKLAMSFEEFGSWAAYIQKRGTQNLGMRVESGFALLATLIQHARGIDCDIDEFMPHFDKKPLSLEEAMKRWG